MAGLRRCSESRRLPHLVGWLLCLTLAVPGQALADAPLPEQYAQCYAGNTSPAGSFCMPSALAMGDDRHLFVADGLNHRVQRLISDGSLLQVWGHRGAAEGQFGLPCDLAWAPDGSLWVADRGNGRMQRFTQEGELLACWSLPEVKGQPSTPNAVAGAPDGSLWVVDTEQASISHFSPDGELLVCLRGPSQAPLVHPTDVVLADDGVVWIADAGSGRLLGCLPGSNWWRIETVVDTGADLEGPWGMAHDLSGSIYLVMTVAAEGHPRAATQTWLQWQDRWGHLGGLALLAEAPSVPDAQCARHPTWHDGNLWVPIPELDQVLRCDAQGQVLGTFGLPTDDRGILREPHSLTAETSGGIAVSDRASDRVHRFTVSGRAMLSTRYDSLRDELLLPAGLTMDGDHLWVVDGGLGPVGGERVQRYGSGGTLSALWGPWGSEGGGLLEPVDIAVSGKDQVLVADTGWGAIRVYDYAGMLQDTWGGPGSALQFGKLDGLALAADGTCLVSDSVNHNVKHLASDGSPLATWGSRGSAAGQFLGPAGLAVDDADRVYVADQGNGRVQALDGTGEWLVTWDRVPEGAIPLLEAGDVALSASGDLYCLDREQACVHLWRADRDSDWTVTWFKGLWHCGAPVTITQQSVIDNHWSSSPVPELPIDYFSARYQRVLALEPGRYRFDLLADDRVRLWVGERLLIEGESLQPEPRSATMVWPGGELLICLEHADRLGMADVALSWEWLGSASDAVGAPDRLWLPMVTGL